MKRKFITFCLAGLLLLTCIGSVTAEEFDPHHLGSISVTLTERSDNTPIVGGELTLYYIATVSAHATGNLSYTYTEDFKGIGVSPDDPTLVTALDAFLSVNDLQGTQCYTDGTGTAVWQDLTLGLYFIRQTGPVEGYALCTPFLVTVPVGNGDGYVYDVNASPKTEVEKLTTITVKKIWNTDAATAATQSVTVHLLRNGVVVETAILNAENQWQVTYTDMPESDAYTIVEADVPEGFIPTYSQLGYVFTVTNTPSLIQTGQLFWPIPVFAIGGLLLIAVGIMLTRKKRAANG